jgi:hypothetical protein
VVQASPREENVPLLRISLQVAILAGFVSGLQRTTGGLHARATARAVRVR